MVRVEPVPRERDIVAERLKWLGAPEGKFNVPDDFDHFADAEIEDMFDLKP